jgi:hypothetical protein
VFNILGNTEDRQLRHYHSQLLKNMIQILECIPFSDLCCIFEWKRSNYLIHRKQLIRFIRIFAFRSFACGIIKWSNQCLFHNVKILLLNPRQCVRGIPNRPYKSAVSQRKLPIFSMFPSFQQYWIVQSHLPTSSRHPIGLGYLEAMMVSTLADPPIEANNIHYWRRQLCFTVSGRRNKSHPFCGSLRIDK